jgi:methanogenic corrinoid protein MtbC1
MNEILVIFKEFLDQDNKEDAVKYILNKLQSKEIDVINLYCNILTSALNQMVCKPEEEKIAVFKEHVQTAIVRTILECSYPYILEKREEVGREKRGSAIILCPPEEYHDLGARMVSDFFTIAGYETIFVGSNTPYQDILYSLQIMKPEIIAISVSNYYNLVAAKRMISEIKQITTLSAKIVVGGYAFHDDDSKYKLIGADYYAKTYDDIIRLTEKGVQV